MSQTIAGFSENYRFLSNFYHAPIFYNGVSYPTVENAYQAAKFATMLPATLVSILGEDHVRQYDPNLSLSHPNLVGMFFASLPPQKAKTMGRKLPLDADWESRKESVMRELVALKFQNNPNLANKLKATGDAIIVEANYWHDNIWGDCTCDRCKQIAGKNLLGHILMDVRANL